MAETRRVAIVTGAAFVDKGALGRNWFDDILGGQYRRIPLLPPSVRRYAFASCGLSLYRTLSGKFSRVISELEIWRAANLLLKRYGDKAGAEGAARADALAAVGDREGEAVWRLITHAVAQLANKTPPGPMH
jgi:hypothetical protein